MAASAILHRSFVDSSHHAFYSQGSSSRQGSSRRVAAVSPRQRRQQTVAASSVSGRRARVLRHVAEVESALARLEQAAPLAAASFTLEHQLAAPEQQQQQQHRLLERTWSTSSSSSSSSSSSAATHTSSDSSESDSSSDSEGEGVQSRLARRLQAQATVRARLERQTSNILAAPLPSVAAATAVAPAAATTVVRVCQGKKCAAAGSAALMAQYASLPGVVVQPTKCLKQCRRCVAVEMASLAGPACGSATLYTGVSGANAAQVLAMHQASLRSSGPPAGASLG